MSGYCGYAGSNESEYDGYVVAYTDGACSDNGQYGAKAGIGVHFPNGEARDISERLRGRQTNNRAEIQAAVRAIRLVTSLGYGGIIVRTDSNFLIDSITKWVKRWTRNGWRSVTGRPIVNRYDFQELLDAMDEIDVSWEKVPAHSGHTGNDIANDLAVKGISK